MGVIGDATRQAFAESDVVMSEARDKTALEVAVDELDRQIQALQEGIESVQHRLGPVLRESYDDLVDEWAQLALDRGASPLAQQIMDRADTLGRIVVNLRTTYGRIDL